MLRVYALKSGISNGVLKDLRDVERRGADAPHWHLQWSIESISWLQDIQYTLSYCASPMEY